MGEPVEPQGGSERARGVRAGDAEREAAVRRLRDGTGEGRLTLEELSGRVERAYAARTREELDTLTADLPADRPVPAPADLAASEGRAPRTRWQVSLVGGTRRQGRFRLEARSASVSLVGGARLDLREAELEGPEIELTQVSLVGGMRLVVPDGVHIEVSGVSVIGGHRVEESEQPPAPGAPVIRVRDFSVVGGVRVSRPGSDRSVRRAKRGRLKR